MCDQIEGRDMEIQDDEPVIYSSAIYFTLSTWLLLQRSSAGKSLSKWFMH